MNTNTNDESSFELGEEDAAIIFRKDMSVEMVLPNLPEDIEIDYDEYQNFYVTIAIMSSLDNPEFRQVIGKKIDEILIDAAEEAAGVDIPKCTCGPEDCSCEEC